MNVVLIVMMNVNVWEKQKSDYVCKSAIMEI
jgi:hypothetical protein